MEKPADQIFDITLPISPGLPVWPGDPPIVLEQVASMDRGDHDNISRLAMSAHTGTHVDAPHHFLNDHRTVEGLSLEVLTGPALVVRLPDEIGRVDADLLETLDLPAGTERLLLRTRNSAMWRRSPVVFETDFVAIDAGGADWLVRRGLRLVGIDALSVAPFKNSLPTHRALLAAGIVILEGLDLGAVEPGPYTLYCLPLKLVGSDGAPARAVLTR